VLQARHHFPEDPNFERILVGHLHDIERRNYPAIGKALGIELEDVIEYHKMIQELEPHPGRGFSSDEPRYITPDLYIDKHAGEWIIQVNEDGMPDLRVSGYYTKIFAKASKADREYLLDKLRGAEFLIKSINKRRRTIVRVMESILKFQRDFFDKGPEGLRPMVLQDVADDIGVHMSTVSRVTTNKYVHTPHGIFELKYFFSAAVRQDAGGDMAAEAIKARIKSVITGEDGKSPLSDQAIADLLEADGINVARRTVAKYREGMGILTSSKRKQMF
jgi:RNA polymerase sigma-54 factor